MATQSAEDENDDANGAKEDNSDSNSSENLIPDSQDVAGEETKHADVDLVLRERVWFQNDKGECMHFIVLHQDADENARIRELLYEYEGSSSDDIRKVTPHSAVMVPDDCRIWSYDKDVFRMSYIQECIKLGMVLNISKYLKTRSMEFCEGFDYMQIVFDRKYTWDSVPEEFKLRKNKPDSDGSDSDAPVEIYRSLQKPTQIDKKTRCAYQRGEKAAIMRYIIANNKYNEVKGVKLWRDMEEAGICPIRTWQSMKEHFLKSIMKEIPKSHTLTNDEKKKFQDGLNRKHGW